MKKKGWVIFAVLGIVGVFVVASSVVAQKRSPLPRVKRVLTQGLNDIEGREVRLEVVDFAPGASAPGHRHDGHAFVYVLEGEIESALEDGPADTFQAGDSFYEPVSGLHAVTRNPSETETAKILVFFIIEEENPSLRFEPR